MTNRMMDIPRFRRLLLPTVAGVLVIAYFLANVEIQIEGAAGWAANLPTWRLKSNWWLEIFWGGREMTGYHAWIFPCITLFFHFPLVFFGRWSWRMEARVIGCILLFWIAEDFLWFVLNPAFGIAKFLPGNTQSSWSLQLCSTCQVSCSGISPACRFSTSDLF